jgi:5S rRNA maturation endonuclease (ribonuclease M5)
MSANPKIEGKIDAALAKLSDLGIDPGLTRQSYRDIVEAGFDKRTIVQSFVLASILVDGHPMSVRSGLYRAGKVYRGTQDKHYRQAQQIILKLRRRGIIPYAWVTDSLRTRRKPSSWAGIDNFAETVRDGFRKDLWSRQKTYIEVVTEKDAMAGTLRPVTDEYDIHLNVIRGNSSESHIYDWIECIKGIKKNIVIYYFGDFDPNGLDIERDIRERAKGFLDKPIIEVIHNAASELKYNWSEPPILWQRLGVTWNDFKNDDLPGFPIKKSESKSWQTRCLPYIEQYGDRCVEVDAIDSKEIRQRLKEAIESHIDQDEWNRLKTIEEAEMETIKASTMLWRAA